MACRLQEEGWHAVRPWESLLSMGEAQCIGVTRALYHKPQFAVLDEATSAMAEDIARETYSVLAEQGVACVSVSAGAAEALQQHHSQLLTLGESHSDGWSIAATNASPSTFDLSADARDTGLRNGRVRDARIDELDLDASEADEAVMSLLNAATGSPSPPSSPAATDAKVAPAPSPVMNGPADGNETDQAVMSLLDAAGQ